MFEGLLEGIGMEPAAKETEDSVLFQSFWDIPTSLKCPVVGLGISDEEGRRILKKCGRRIKALAPWEVHRDIMEEVGSGTAVARRVDAVLKRKFADALDKVKALPEKELLPLLKASIANGEAAEALYCVSMRKNLAVDVLVSVVGEAHMMGHTTATDLLEARKKEVKSAGKVKELTKSLDTERRERRRLGRELQAMVDEVRELRQALSKQAEASVVVPEIRSEPKAVTVDPDALKQERDKRKERERERDALAREARKLEREKRKLKTRVLEIESENKALADEVMSLAIGRPAPLPCEGRGCSTCPEMETCSRRILMVGGLSRMEPHYRRVAEAKGLGFEYHDGTMSGGRKCLEKQVSRCDMVVCPVTCNSHNACRSVKKLCSKHNKEIRFLPTSSISALTGVLLDMPA